MVRFTAWLRCDCAPFATAAGIVCPARTRTRSRTETVVLIDELNPERNRTRTRSRTRIGTVRIQPGGRIERVELQNRCRRFEFEFELELVPPSRCKNCRRVEFEFELMLRCSGSFLF